MVTMLKRAPSAVEKAWSQRSTPKQGEAGARTIILSHVRDALLASQCVRDSVGRAGGIWLGTAPCDMLPFCVVRTAVAGGSCWSEHPGVTLQINFVFPLDDHSNIDECMAHSYFQIKRTILPVGSLESLDPGLDLYQTFPGVVTPDRTLGVLQFTFRENSRLGKICQ